MYIPRVFAEYGADVQELDDLLQLPARIKIEAGTQAFLATATRAATMPSLPTSVLPTSSLPISALPPMSRDTMKSLKARETQDRVQAKVNEIVRKIYECAIVSAKEVDATCYRFPVPKIPASKSAYKYTPSMSPFDMTTNDIFVTYIDIILTQLQQLFPGCDITRKLLSRGEDWQLHDCSQMEGCVRGIVHRQFDQEYIVIEWG